MKDKVKVYNLVDTDLLEIAMSGTLEDIRIHIKDQWKAGLQNLIIDFFGFDLEEDYYQFVDTNFDEVVSRLGFDLKEICEVPIEDFEETNDSEKEIWNRTEVVQLLKHFVGDTRGDKPWVDADDEWVEQNLKQIWFYQK